jgi:prephenate dehydratase
MKVAFQGERGAFSEEAARRFLGPDLALVPCGSFAEAFRRLARGEVDRAVIPMENSLAGSVHENYDLLLKSRLAILAETQVRIELHLVAPPGVRLAAIRRVFSHPVALNQCRKFFAGRRNLQAAPFYDTAGSVKMLMEQRPPDAAAIAPAASARIYGARILRRGLEDDKRNYTRFFLLARSLRGIARPKSTKTSIVFTTPNVPGALFRCLAVFALRDISLTKIESRPRHGRPWEYLFYLDFMGRPEDSAGRNALRHLAEITDSLRVLGSYPQIG